MKKTKYLILALLAVAVIFMVPNVVKATSETWKDTAQNIDWCYELDSSGNIINLNCNTSIVSGTVKIPSTINGKTVISLNGGVDYNGSYKTDGVFKDCTGLTGVEIPNTIIEIGEYAFNGCTGLKSVIIPDSVTKIGYYAFNGCVGLTNVTFSKNISMIDNYAFEDCSGLTKIVLPDSLTTLGDGVFRGCSGLKEITLSENLTKINASTFRNCSGLTSVILPYSITSIATNVWGAFEGCTNLKKIKIPDSVVSIDKNAFSGCDNLTIYGNDGSVAKKYAEDNSIKFDYISNWNKQTSGTDVTAPTVTSIEVPYSSVSKYNNNDQYVVPANAKLTINVNFSEEIKGTIPTLIIKFGDGQNIEIKDGAISGSSIKYVYTIKSSDLGIMSTVDLTGGDITDLAGNKAVLSCPKVVVPYFSRVIYANGTITNPETPDSNNNQSPNDKQNSDDGDNKKTEGKKDPEENQDPTTAKGSLPYAGAGIGLIISILALAGIGTFAYLRYNGLRDVK